MGEKIRFALKLAKSRWLVIVAAILIQCVSGASYTFGIYSQALKGAFNYDQKSLDTLAVFKDLGANVGVVSGLVYDWFSPWGVLAIGAVLYGGGYLMLWLPLSGRIAIPELWQACLYLFLATNGQTFLSTSCVVTCVQNFPRNRGVVIGLMKGFLGLSGAILTQLYHGIYGPNDPSSYLLLISWLPSLIIVSLMFIVRPIPAHQARHESTNLYVISTGAVSFAAFLMGVILLENTVQIGHVGDVAVCVLICGILLLPLGVVVKSELQEAAEASTSSFLRQPLMIDNGLDSSSNPHSGAVPTPADVEGGELGESQQKSSSTGAEFESSTRSSADNEESGAPSARNPSEKTDLVDAQPGVKSPSRGQDHTIAQALGKGDFWLLFLAMACGMGSGLTAIDNTGQIGASLGYSPKGVANFVSLFSIWNFLGRLGFGALSEICLHRYKTGRPVLLAYSQAVMALGHLLISSAIPGSLYPGSVVIGLCYGAQWSLMPAITSELFGLRRFATLFNSISIASPLGAYFLSVQLTGRLYDFEAAKEHYPGNRWAIFQWLREEDLDCHGAHCFRLTFIIMAAVSLFGCTVCVLLVNRTRSFYAQMLHH